jgi:hypothetical protein
MLTQDKGMKLSSCLEGVSLEGMQLLLRYCYARCPCDVAKGLSNSELEAVAPLADRFGVAAFLEDADALLHGAHRSVHLPEDPSLQCRLPSAWQPICLLCN